MSLSLDDSILNNYKSRYSNVHPLVFQRSVERANSALELFEILEKVPLKPPYSWSESKRAWIVERDAMGLEAMESMMKK